MISRRGLLTAGAVAAASLNLAWPARAAQSSRYGIVGQDAPELEVDFWIDGAGRPTRFSMTESRGKVGVPQVLPVLVPRVSLAGLSDIEDRFR